MIAETQIQIIWCENYNPMMPIDVKLMTKLVCLGEHHHIQHSILILFNLNEGNILRIYRLLVLMFIRVVE